MPRPANLLTPPATPITLTEGRTTAVTVTLVRRKFGTAEGTVRDRATGVPIEGVSVNGNPTGPDGRYRIEDIGLNGLNEPADLVVTAFDPQTPPTYWASPSTQVTVRADEVTVAPDLLMVRICEPATVRGRVVNAVDTQIHRGGAGDRRIAGALTDIDGRFVVTGIAVGTDNQNLDYGVVASKTGFVTAQKNVTSAARPTSWSTSDADGDGAGTISGRITDSTGGPVDLAQVTTGFGGSARTDSNGRVHDQRCAGG